MTLTKPKRLLKVGKAEIAPTPNSKRPTLATIFDSMNQRFPKATAIIISKKDALAAGFKE